MKFVRGVISAVLASTFLTSMCIAGPVARIYLTPGHLSVRPGMQQQFQVYGLDAFDKEAPITEPITWSTVAGTISQTGQFNAGAATGRYMQGIKVTTPSGLTGLAIVTISAPAPVGGYAYERSWGDFVPGDQRDAGDMCMGPNDSILVCDSYANRVVQYASDGTYLNQIGPMYDYKMQYYPRSVGAFGQYVYTGEDDGVLVFDSTGRAIAKYGTDGTGNGQFKGVYGIATDKNGYIYAQDSNNYRIQKLSPSGTFVASFGSKGSADGQFANGFEMVVDPNGNTYVADYGNNRIQKFSPTGAFVTKWNTIDPDSGSVLSPVSIVLDPSGNIVFTASYVSKIFKLTLSDSKITPVTFNAPIVNPGRLLLDSRGNMYFAKSDTDSTVVFIEKYNPQGDLIAEWGRHRKNALRHAHGLGVGPDGNIYVADTYSHLIKKFDPVGELLGSWEGGRYPMNARVDSNGDVFATDAYGGTKYNSKGRALSKFPLPNGGRAYGIAPAPNGDVYISSDSEEAIYRFGASGNLISQWGSPGTGTGQFSWLHSIAADSDSNIFAVDSNNGRIQKFDATGKFLYQWVGMSQPWGICYAPSGYIFTAEEGADRVQKWTTAGVPISQWGGLGLVAGKFCGCNDVAVHANDNVYVADMLNNRICKYVPVQQTPSKSKEMKNGDFVALSNQVVTATANDFGDGIYIEAADRSSGIRVITNTTIGRWWKVTVTGILDTIDGERVIRASNVTYNDATIIQPLGLTNKALGGGDLNYDPQTGKGQRGVEDGAGANNIGLLVKTTGKVTGAGTDFFYIDDGTHAHDGSIFVGVRVKCKTLTKPKLGSKVTVTGISRINKIGERYFRSLSARYQGDIVLAP